MATVRVGVVEMLMMDHVMKGFRRLFQRMRMCPLLYGKVVPYGPGLKSLLSVTG